MLDLKSKGKSAHIPFQVQQHWRTPYFLAWPLDEFGMGTACDVDMFGGS